MYEEEYSDWREQWETPLQCFLHKPSKDDLRKYTKWSLDETQVEALLEEGVCDTGETEKSLVLYEVEVLDNS